MLTITEHENNGLSVALKPKSPARDLMHSIQQLSSLPSVVVFIDLVFLLPPPSIR